jgi:hypothetical protein
LHTIVARCGNGTHQTSFDVMPHRLWITPTCIAKATTASGANSQNLAASPWQRGSFGK